MTKWTVKIKDKTYNYKEPICTNSNQAISMATDDYYEETQEQIYTDDKNIVCTETESDGIDENTYTELLDARDKLCAYCQCNECENCTVTHLIDDAHDEAIEAGIIKDY